MPGGLTATQRTLRAQIGAYALHASHDPRETTAKARATFLARFEVQVDPDGLLSAPERQRRAGYARKAHFKRLALASTRKRSGKKTTAVGKTAAVAVEAEVMGGRDPQLQPT